MSVSVSDLTVTKPWYPFLTSHLFGGTQDNCSQNIRFLSDLGPKIYPRNIRPNIGAHPGFAGVLAAYKMMGSCHVDRVIARTQAIRPQTKPTNGRCHKLSIHSSCDVKQNEVARWDSWILSANLRMEDPLVEVTMNGEVGVLGITESC